MTSEVDVKEEVWLQDSALRELSAAQNYQQWLSGLAAPYLGTDPIEIGAGLGDYAQQWLNGGLPKITLTEVEPSRRAALMERFRGDSRVRVENIDLFDPPAAEHSCMVSFNVFEHIEHDVDALRAAHSIIRPGGYVFTFVPAFPFAYSRFDMELGHFRRYTIRTLTAALRSADLEPVDVYYSNAPGLVAWTIGMRLLRLRAEGPAVGFWDRYVVPIASRIERRWRLPFGQSCVGLARVPASTRKAIHPGVVAGLGVAIRPATPTSPQVPAGEGA